MKIRTIETKILMGMLILLSVSDNLQARGQKGQNEKSRGVWMSELNLNHQQMQKINQLRDQMQPAIMDIRHKNRSMELELSRLNRQGLSKEERATVLKQTIAANTQSIAALQQSQRAQIRILLTTDQQLIFDRYGNRAMASNKRGNNRGKNMRQFDAQCTGRRSRG